ncbi:carboxylating nicotinate-nucleotide diphosphorylase [Haloimpatiens sp. FM7315]|uniref:carboxylating nicotinate-nucleotide diphosphorylase n=1 Tax=Haloimpatiens sp. FM7315 TaxID=3298609 RepID=UPI0035A2AB33
MNWLVVDKIIENALIEDCTYGDITTESIISKESNSKADLIAKEEGIISGLEVFERVFSILGDVRVKAFFKDGDLVKNKDIIGVLEGNTINILKGERVALNLMQRMSGIATMTGKFLKEVSHTKAKILDTRKTTPNLRILEKYSVKIAGGTNHRFNLSDGILIKDNHISAAGGIKKAILKAKSSCSFVRKVEVEVENLEGVLEAIEAGADIIMLDNMDLDSMKKAVKLIDGRALTEASGNVNIKTIKSIAETGVDYISLGALTHSFKSLDISLKNLRNI